MLFKENRLYEAKEKFSKSDVFPSEIIFLDLIY